MGTVGCHESQRPTIHRLSPAQPEGRKNLPKIRVTKNRVIHTPPPRAFIRAIVPPGANMRVIFLALLFALALVEVDAMIEAREFAVNPKSLFRELWSKRTTTNHHHHHHHHQTTKPPNHQTTKPTNHQTINPSTNPNTNTQTPPLLPPCRQFEFAVGGKLNITFNLAPNTPAARKRKNSVQVKQK